MVEDGHQHLVVPAAVVPDRLPAAPLFAESGLSVGADPGLVELGDGELDPVQAHLPEAVADDDPHRVRAVAAAHVLAGEPDPDRRAPVLGTNAPQPDAADQHRRVAERLDGEAEVVTFVRAGLRDLLSCRGFRRRDHPVVQRAHPAGIHLPFRQDGQVVVAHGTQPDPFADQKLVAVAERAGHIGEFRHTAILPYRGGGVSQAGARPAARRQARLRAAHAAGTSVPWSRTSATRSRTARSAAP